jgi:large subunit ribosomal protein L21
MFAVFESGGKQHRVSEGEVVRLERLDGEPGDAVEFDKVMLIAEGDDVNVGAPYIDGGKVTAEVVATDRGRKIRVVKFKRRKNYLRRHGHRQWFTDVRITGISGK